MARCWLRGRCGRLQATCVSLAHQGRDGRRRGGLGSIRVRWADRREAWRWRRRRAARQQKPGQCDACGSDLHGSSPFVERRRMDSAPITAPARGLCENPGAAEAARASAEAQIRRIEGTDGGGAWGERGRRAGRTRLSARGTRVWPACGIEIPRAIPTATRAVADSSSWAVMHTQEQASAFARRPAPPPWPQWPPPESAGCVISAQAQGTAPTLARRSARSMTVPRAEWRLTTNLRVVDAGRPGQGRRLSADLRPRHGASIPGGARSLTTAGRSTAAP